MPIGNVDASQPTTVTAFCQRLYPRLVGALALDTGDLGLAEEIAQEALFRTYQRWAVVAAMECPEAWTFRVAFNLRSSGLRRRQLERRVARRGPAHDVPAEVDDSADALAVREAIACLPPRQRQAIVLRYFADLTVHDTAELMRCRDGTVKALTSQGLSSLRRALGEVDAEEVS